MPAHAEKHIILIFLPVNIHSASLRAITMACGMSKAPMNITIPSHWWEIIWIQIGAFLLLGFGCVCVISKPHFYIQKAEAHKTEINRQLAELEMKALRAQMNPISFSIALILFRDAFLLKKQRMHTVIFLNSQNCCE